MLDENPYHESMTKVWVLQYNVVTFSRSYDVAVTECQTISRHGNIQSIRESSRIALTGKWIKQSRTTVHKAVREEGRIGGPI